MKYNVTGMSCSACVSRVERAVLSVEGVDKCEVSLLTNSMKVEGGADSEQIINAVKDAGYGASLVERGSKNKGGKSKDIEDAGTKKTLARLISSLVILLPLMYISMGHTMLSLPVMSFLEDNYVALGILQMLLCGIILVINQKFFINGAKGIIKKSPNMDTLVALGSGASFIYSTARLFEMTVSAEPQHILHDLYFESSAMILVLITVGKMLESYSKGKTTSALKELISLQPRSAILIIDGVEKEVEIEKIQRGDIFVVKTGAGVPVDGEVIEGSASVNEASLTGESIPCDKEVGDTVYAGTISHSGYIKCRAKTNSEETVLAEIIETVSASATSKAPIARIADIVSGIFVPVVITLAVLTTIVWLLLDREIGFALGRGISVLVISCPCALGLATPVAIMVGNGVGARNGVLFKNATALENTGRAKLVAFDKTGTITKGEPVVTDLIPYGVGERELLLLAYALEAKSEHPLARAIVKRAEDEGIELTESEDFTALVGSGAECVVNGSTITGGSYKLAKERTSIDDDTEEQFKALTEKGKTPLFFLRDNSLIGIIAVRDEIKEDSYEAVCELKNMGLDVVMLTGDNTRSANAIAKEVGIERVIAELMPSEKQRAIEELKNQGKTVMVGDGINDSVALVTADIGMAIGQGTEIAIESAQVVLMGSELSGVAKAIKISRATLRSIHQNLFWAFIYNIIGIPLAMGVFISWLGWELSPMVGALAMSLSSFCVVTNALRLNLINLKKENKKMLFKKKEEGKKAVLNVEGMMCPHCEARVKSAVEAIEGVERAEPSHKKNTVTVYGECDIEAVKSVITAEGYTVK
ncbi:MAG: heavy metal translocating P-type ATPase [Clostridia bacterium]|nr:heavy metal translocating P-type ATPase [Clostridia bacterium]